MTFLVNIYNWFAGFPWEGFYYTARSILIPLDVVLLIGFLFALRKAWEFRPDLISPFETENAVAVKKSAFDVAKFRKHWQEIQKKSASAPPQSFTLAIMAADNLVGNALDDMGLEGEHIADKLENLDPRELKTLNSLWRAHRVRNDLVHTSGFEIKDSEAEEILNIYESFLEEIGALK